jgi:archaellum component FlaC
MPDYELVGKGETKDIEASLTQVEQRLAELNQIQSKAQAGAKELAGGLGLTSKELSAAARAAGLTSSELKHLIKEEKITAEEAKKLAAAQQEADSKTKGLKESSADTARSLGDMAKAAAAFIAAKLVNEVKDAAVELYNIGAAAERAEFALNTLSTGRADEYIEAIQSASRNTVSEMDAMTIANKALQFGIVSNAEGMGHLTQVAVALGRVMGTDATKAFDDLTTAGARQSKLIADNLGIIIDMNRVSADAAALMRENTGLTEDQARAQAFLNQIIEAGSTPQMEAILANQDAAESAERLTANIEDLKKEMGSLTAEALNPLVERFTAGIDGLNRYFDAVDEAKRGTAASAASFEDYLDVLAQHGIVNAQLVKAYEKRAGSIENVDKLNNIDAATIRRLHTEYMELAQQADAASRAQEAQTASTQAEAAAARYSAYIHEDLTEALNAVAEANQTLDPAILSVVDALDRGAISVEEANAQLQALGATEEDVQAATAGLADAQREAEQAARAYQQALRDQQREHEALAGIVASTSEDIARTGAAAWANSEESGQAYLEFLRAAGVDLSLFPGKYDEIRLAAGLVTEEELKVEQGLRLLSEAMGKIDPTMGLHLFEEWSSGAISDIDELQARIDDLTKPVNATQAEHAMELAAQQADNAVTQMEKQAKAGQDAFDKARIAAEEDLAEVNQALGTVSETLDDVADAVDRSFGRMADGANDTSTAMGHISTAVAGIVGPLSALPAVAAAAFGSLSSTAVSAANAVGTIVNAVGAIATAATPAASAVSLIATATTAAATAFAGMASSADSAYDSIDAVRGSVAVLRSHWEWLLNHRTLNLVANYTQNGGPGSGDGGYIPEGYVNTPRSIGIEGIAPSTGAPIRTGQPPMSLQNFGPIYVQPLSVPFGLSDILIDVSAQLAPSFATGVAE